MTAFALAQAGELDLAIAAWTAGIMQGSSDPALLYNIRLAEKHLEKQAKVSFLANNQDERIGEYLLHLQRTIGDHSDLAQAIATLENDWLQSPDRNLYAWALEQIRLTEGPKEKVLALAAIAEYLEQAADIQVAPRLGPEPREFLSQPVEVKHAYRI